MNRAEHLLVILGEEAAEVTKEAAKCLRFGPTEVYPAVGISNIQRVVNEFNDIYAMMVMLQADGIIKGDFIDTLAISNKIDKVEAHLLYSKNCGTLS